jgi:UDP-N-acetylmuramyl pentapeptide phosphotransferase/UDP-N-acetylglucosamine-1-phosphate transferase
MLRLIEFVAVTGLSFFGVALMRHLAHAHSILDIPNERSSHTNSVPRGGGVPIVLLTLAGIWILNVANQTFQKWGLVGYTIGAILIAGISWLDDLYSMSNLLRFSVHSVAALLAIYSLGYLPVGKIVPGSLWLTAPLGVVITFIWIVGLTNAYNFMDGIDGIAGGQALIAGIAWAIVGGMTGQPIVMTLGLLLAASTLGFLVHNWPPARIFMGDVGSAFLGFTLAVLPLIFNEYSPPAGRGLRIPFAGAIFVWPFVFDSTITFLGRLFRGEKVFQAHRSHLYQQLVISGITHKTVSLLYSTLAILGAGLALGWIAGWRNSFFGLITILPFLGISLLFLVRRQNVREVVREQI